MKLTQIALLLSLILIGCTTTIPKSPIKFTLYNDLNMPAFGINESNSPTNYRPLKIITVSTNSKSGTNGNSILGRGNIVNDLGFSRDALQDELLKRASSFGANSVINIKITEKVLSTENKFGERIPNKRVVMTGLAIFDPSHNKRYINTLIFDAFNHKYKNKFGAIDEKNCKFYQAENGDIQLDYYHTLTSNNFRLTLTKAEIEEFQRENTQSYRWRHTEIIVED